MKENFTETYEFLVSIIGNAPYGIVAIDLEGDITMINQLAIGQLGIDKKVGEIVETALHQYLQHVPRLQKKLFKMVEKGRANFDLNNIKIEEHILNIKGRKILNGMIITTADMTEAKEMERKMLSAMLEGQEKERKRLAKEIHDGIGPLMSTLKLNIDSVKNEMEGTAETTIQKMENMEQLVQEVATDIRSISHALMPSALKDFGLIPTLEQLCNKVNAAEKVKVQFISNQLNKKLKSKMELGLYRIAQELLNNALKYAQAKIIIIQLIGHQDQITLTVEDDGIGFDKEQLGQLLETGIGLRNIKTRVQLLKGIFTLDTNPGHGVIATIEIPYSSTNTKKTATK